MTRRSRTETKNVTTWKNISRQNEIDRHTITAEHYRERSKSKRRTQLAEFQMN